MVLSFTLQQLAELTGSKLIGNGQLQITHVSDLESASPEEASFLANARYYQAMAKSKAGVVFVQEQVTLVPNKNFLVHLDPSRAFQQVIELFYPPRKISGFSGIHSTAVIHSEAILGQDVSVGPHAVIESGARIGDRTFIGAGTYVGLAAQIGADCIIHPHVTLREGTILGARVILQPGVVLGSCGFGYTTDQKGKHHKLQQVGIVTVEDDVEIGANTTIDRARFKTTRIGRGTKIDNLTQIAHAVSIGEDNFIVAQTGVAGSSKTGRNVILAGQSAITGHVSIADGTIIAARGGVTKSILQAGKYGGNPAMPLLEHHRHEVHLRNIKKYVKRIEGLEQKLEALEVREKLMKLLH